MFVARFEHLPPDAVNLAGGKGASLGRMKRAGLDVPPGFVVTAAALHAYLNEHGLLTRIGALTAGLDVHDAAALESAASAIQREILAHPLDPALSAAIVEAWDALAADAACAARVSAVGGLPVAGVRAGGAPLVAVRSSAVSEDGEAASFAGQQETFLNVRGAGAVMARIADCWASFFSGRALFYRAQKGAIEDTRMAVVVQEMVAAEKSGVMFTVDPIERRRDRMVVEAVFGLGEGIVSGMLTPDHYVLDRDDGSIVREFVAVQTSALVSDIDAGTTRQVELDEETGGARVLTDAELARLRDAGLRLESIFGAPQDVEWCVRGGDLRLLQSRPITTL